MSDSHHYFSIGAGSPLWAEIAKFRAHERAQLRFAKAVEKELCHPRTDGLEERLWGYGLGAVVGIQVCVVKKGTARSLTMDERRIDRPGWRFRASDRVNVPDKRTPEGRAIAARLREAPGNLVWMNISQRLFKHDYVMSGMKTHFAVIDYRSRGPAGVRMAACVLRKIDPALIKTYRMKEITATKFNALLGIKEAA